MKKSTLLSLITATLMSSAVYSASQPIAIAIHGGAGTIEKSRFTPEQEAAYRDTLRQAVEAGYAQLERGHTSLDAVTQAITILENSPFFNAGKGAVYTHDESHEMDASIMLGQSREAGAVAGVKHIENPINLARLVMEKSVHVMLSGQGAEEFAVSQGMTLVDNSLFDTPHRLDALKRAKEKLKQAQKQLDYQAAHQALPIEYKVGTVGAVALDKAGNIVAGTSTGGMTNKRFGRIGDSPIIGAGTFADNQSCAVSATGHGEYFIRYNVAADICARVQYQGKSIATAGKEVIFGPMLSAGGTGGVIILNTNGEISMPFNTKGMYRASKTNTQPTYVGIFAGE
ncbi:beta-aspartyl-peptidase (threonine type) [Pseudoalteromonas ulvae UL12]|uniref:isoaspartyl peptidase/L-asparaginase family protein n=1 Tax=Pseudoalteromonas ulvae TaxID=107327 RepID=UPI00186BAEDB|nr:isoaspartyl peptidase/L-asparaginase [Pseudoalteromonas ulvae]MBE0362372.1 beta-aspartyl-peptidase (threonine type) [Pseudoalteromonas ulvae UL12]